MMTRRTVLKNMATFVAGGVAGGAALTGWNAARRTYRPSPNPVGAVTPRASPDISRLALSLRAYQRSLADSFGKGAIPDANLRELAGLNVIAGFIRDTSGDVVLFGEHRAALPALNVNDALVALRSAYQVGPDYEVPVGCSIDPDPKAADPWKRQVARVLGMPVTAPMGRRHLDVDYDLKRASAGLASPSSVRRVTSVFDFESTRDLCHSSGGPTSSAATHRFWFYPRYADDKPRFVRDDATVLIRHAVGVQLLTEEEFLEHGTRVGAAPPQPAAAAFAKSVTELLGTDEVLEYVRLRHDFRLIEVAKLLRFAGLTADALTYLLTMCPMDAVKPHTWFGGIRRREQGQATCDVDVREERTRSGHRTTIVESVRRYERDFRGGVEVAVSVEAADFGVPHQRHLSTLHNEIVSHRPSPDAVSWPLS